MINQQDGELPTRFYGLIFVRCDAPFGNPELCDMGVNLSFCGPGRHSTRGTGAIFLFVFDATRS
jgi:hypothetical protein